MGFTEQLFLFAFMPLSIVIYSITSHFKKIKLQNALILIFSIAFYAWSSLETLLLFLLLCGFIYLLGYTIFLQKDSQRIKKRNTIIATLFILAPLCYFKYINFIIKTINDITHSNLTFIELLAPIGISFLVFEGISYVIDIERGLAKPGNFFDALLFLSFFPKIVSGPIVLWRDFENQIRERSFNYEQVSHGFQRIIIGYAEKVIIADTFGAKISDIEALTNGINDTPTVWLISLLYFFEIYFDFSGYSQIAIGLSEIFGFSFKENFNFPYTSTSISEFWRRWHISLGSFFREYVYIPLGGNRTGNVYVNLFVVFLLTGIWHGANWTFILWGCVHGIFIIIERFLKDKKAYTSIPTIIKWLFTISIVFFAWVLFRSEDINAAIDTYKAMFNISEALPVNFTYEFFLTQKIITLLIVATIFSVISVVKVPDTLKKHCNDTIVLALKNIALLLLFILDIVFIVNSTYSPFIYFQF